MRVRKNIIMRSPRRRPLSSLNIMFMYRMTDERKHMHLDKRNQNKEGTTKTSASSFLSEPRAGLTFGIAQLPRRLVRSRRATATALAAPRRTRGGGGDAAAQASKERSRSPRRTMMRCQTFGEDTHAPPCHARRASWAGATTRRAGGVSVSTTTTSCLVCENDRQHIEP